RDRARSLRARRERGSGRDDRREADGGAQARRRRRVRPLRERLPRLSRRRELPRRARGAREVSAAAPAIGVVRLAHGDGLPLPAYMTSGAAGADVVAAVAGDLVLLPGERALIPTGFAVEVPRGYELQVRP